MQVGNEACMRESLWAAVRVVMTACGRVRPRFTNPACAHPCLRFLSHTESGSCGAGAALWHCPEMSACRQVGKWSRGQVDSWASGLVGKWTRGQTDLLIRGLVDKGTLGQAGLWAKGLVGKRACGYEGLWTCGRASWRSGCHDRAGRISKGVLPLVQAVHARGQAGPGGSNERSHLRATPSAMP